MEHGAPKYVLLTGRPVFIVFVFFPGMFAGCFPVHVRVNLRCVAVGVGWGWGGFRVGC